MFRDPSVPFPAAFLPSHTVDSRWNRCCSIACMLLPHMSKYRFVGPAILNPVQRLTILHEAPVVCVVFGVHHVFDASEADPMLRAPRVCSDVVVSARIFIRKPYLAPWALPPVRVDLNPILCLVPRQFCDGTGAKTMLLQHVV